MNSTNPFLRAFFRSTLPEQCQPPHSYLLLVPCTASLLKTNVADAPGIIASEEFLGSHILKIPPESLDPNTDEQSPLDSKSKTEEVPTFNGKTVYFSKGKVCAGNGFNLTARETVLCDALYHERHPNLQPWLIFYIMNPLISPFWSIMPWSPRSSPQNFDEILQEYPLIAQQMNPGIDEVSHRFIGEVQKPSSGLAAGSSVASSHTSNPFSEFHSASTSPHLPISSGFSTGVYPEKDEDILRSSYEKAVSSAIDLFLQVDQQHLSRLGASSNLTGSIVERYIEKYTAQRFHAPFLLPCLSEAHSINNRRIDERLRRMKHLDVSQVGMVIGNGRQGKEEVLKRLNKGVRAFAWMEDTTCPQDMLDVLLATVKAMTTSNRENYNSSEKSLITVNADALVSLLLMVLVRTRVSNLETILVYMQKFLFIDDVENGEIGYTLSTYEAVLNYILRDSASLRIASATNRRLWDAVTNGRILELKAMLIRDFSGFHDEYYDMTDNTDELDNSIDLDPEDANSVHTQTRPPLAHVFPFQTWAQPSTALPRVTKRVRMLSDARSLSESSSASTPLSGDFPPWVEENGNDNDISPHVLVKTQDDSDNSILMMAVKAKQAETLKYLLSLEDLISVDDVLGDVNREGKTLLISAVELSDAKSADIVLDYLSQAAEPRKLVNYYSRADNNERTVAHYIFNLPFIMLRLRDSIPWRHKDKTGRTPLFALLRSYDHPNYNSIVHTAITLATRAQGDGKPLHLDEHVDYRGKTLLHIIRDPEILYRVLRECDCDPNAVSRKRHTPLMIASKYGRIPCIEILFNDPRVDINVREARGWKAMELSKDDEVRNRLDDMVLFSSLPPDSTQRVTSVVRADILEDVTFRCIIKSGAPERSESPPPNDNDEVYSDSNKSDTQAPNIYLITTCRRTLRDFYNLLRFLRIEHPASYIPTLPDYPMPSIVPYRACRALVNEIRDRLDFLLKALLAHPTFSTHEMLWEFLLVPELRTEMVEERSRRKAAVLAESISDDYRAVSKDGIREIERLVTYSRDSVETVHHNSVSVIQNGHQLHNTTSDFGEALELFALEIAKLQFPAHALPPSYVLTFCRYVTHMYTSHLDTSHLGRFMTAFTSLHSTTTAMLESLSRPQSLIAHLDSSTCVLVRSQSSLASSSAPRRFNIPGLGDARAKSMRELEARVLALTDEIEQLSKEISWNKNVIVGELAGWTSWREEVGKQMVKSFARSSLIQERERKKNLDRCLTNIRESRSEKPHIDPERADSTLINFIHGGTAEVFYER